MPCSRTQHQKNVPRLKREKNDISLKILHQVGFETARQVATSAEYNAVPIYPCPSLMAAHRLQCRPNVTPALVQWLEFAGHVIRGKHYMARPGMMPGFRGMSHYIYI